MRYRVHLYDRRLPHDMQPAAVEVDCSAPPDVHTDPEFVVFTRDAARVATFRRELVQAVYEVPAPGWRGWAAPAGSHASSGPPGPTAVPPAGRRSARWLFGAWAGYWAALTTVALWTPATLLLRLRRTAPPGAVTATANADGALTLRLTEHGATAWSAAMSYTELAFWLAVPPLALWAAWLWWGRASAAPAVRVDRVARLDARHDEQLLAASPAMPSAAAGGARDPVGAPVNRAG